MYGGNIDNDDSVDGDDKNEVNDNGDNKNMYYENAWQRFLPC